MNRWNILKPSLALSCNAVQGKEHGLSPTSHPKANIERDFELFMYLPLLSSILLVFFSLAKYSRRYSFVVVRSKDCFYTVGHYTSNPNRPL